MNFMIAAYLRRKKWEHRELAVAVLNALGEGMGGSNVRSSTYIAGHREISPEEMMQRIK